MNNPIGGKRVKKRGIAGAVVRQLLLIGITILALYPLFWMIITAFKSQEAYMINKFGLPWPLLAQNFIGAMRGGRFARWFLNSLVVTAFTTGIVVLVASLGSFVFAKMPFKGSRTLLNFIISLMVIPPVVMIVPLFILYNQLNLHSTYQGIIILYTGLTLPFSVYLLNNFFLTIPHDIVESALMDGCRPGKVLFSIFFPLSGPAIVTMIVVNTLWVWNEMLLALVFLPKDNMRTLMVGITAFRSKLNLDIPITMAGLLLSTLPVLLLYIAFQKVFIKGLTEGATKG